jgi:hypothetical protein
MELNLINIHDAFLRTLFSSSWIIVIFQYLYIQTGLHRFAVLSITNKIQAFAYFIILFLFISFISKLKKPSFNIITIFIGSIILLLIGIVNNPLNSALVDFSVLIMQFTFYYIGWIYFDRLGNEDIIKKLLNDSLFFSFFLGLIAFSAGFQELVTPMLGFLALSVYASMRFGKRFNKHFWAMLIIMNILWSFGKQTLLTSVIAIIFVHLNPSIIRSVFSNSQSIYNNFFKLLIFFSISTFSFFLLASLSIEFSSIRKLILLIENMNLDIPFSVLLNNPELVYEIVDVSTAGRIYELIIVFNSHSNTYLSFIFGSGVGGEMDLGYKNELAGLDFSFGTTRVAQTLPVFLFLKFGLFGILIFLLLFIKYLVKRKNSQFLFYPFFLCLLMSIIAFSTVFKFHFVGFFWGAMVAQISQSKLKKQNAK